MKADARATPYHPRWYRQPVSMWWWLRRRSYFLFVLRELSSVFVALFAGTLLWHLAALRAGPEAYAEWLATLRSPGVLTLHAVALVFVVFHAVTWFLLVPQAVDLRPRGKRVPDRVLAVASFAIWLLASVAIGWILMGR
jgi:fumarate reductase subunit C